MLTGKFNWGEVVEFVGGSPRATHAPPLTVSFYFAAVIASIQTKKSCTELQPTVAIFKGTTQWEIASLHPLFHFFVRNDG